MCYLQFLDSVDSAAFASVGRVPNPLPMPSHRQLIGCRRARTRAERASALIPALQVCVTMVRLKYIYSNILTHTYNLKFFFADCNIRVDSVTLPRYCSAITRQLRLHLRTSVPGAAAEATARRGRLPTQQAPPQCSDPRSPPSSGRRRAVCARKAPPSPPSPSNWALPGAPSPTAPTRKAG